MSFIFAFFLGMRSRYLQTTPPRLHGTIRSTHSSLEGDVQLPTAFSFFFSVFLVSLFSLYISLSCSFPCLNKFVSICVPDSGRKHKNTGRARRQLRLLKTFLPQIPLMCGVSA